MLKFIALSLFVFIFSKNIFAAIKINEIYPAPPSGEYEWVEIYNDENTIIDLSQYSLSDLTNKKIKFANTILQPLSFEIATSSGVLNNDGDTVFLKNNLEEIIDVATYSANFDSNKTFAKCPNGNWFVLNMPTKNATNETACQILTPTPTPIITLTPILTVTPTTTPLRPTGFEGQAPTLIEDPTPTPTPQSYDNIYLSEAMVNPSTGEKEWVEIYNDNDFSVSLNDWYIDDLENAGSSPKIFSLQINGKSYAVFDLTSYMFNNNGDSIRLLDFNKNLKDDFEYQKTEQGKTLARTSFKSDNFCLQEPSKSFINNSCIYSESLVTFSASTEQGNLSLTINNILSKIPVGKINSPDISNRRNINYPTGIIQKNYSNGQILGVTDELIVNTSNNKSLINLLSILSSSYCLLTIISILFKMRSSYGKNKNFYSPSFYSS